MERVKIRPWSGFFVVFVGLLFVWLGLYHVDNKLTWNPQTRLADPSPFSYKKPNEFSFSCRNPNVVLCSLSRSPSPLSSSTFKPQPHFLSSYYYSHVRFVYYPFWPTTNWISRWFLQMTALTSLQRDIQAFADSVALWKTQVDKVKLGIAGFEYELGKICSKAKFDFEKFKAKHDKRWKYLGGIEGVYKNIGIKSAPQAEEYILLFNTKNIADRAGVEVNEELSATEYIQAAQTQIQTEAMMAWERFYHAPEQENFRQAEKATIEANKALRKARAQQAKETREANEANAKDEPVVEEEPIPEECKVAYDAIVAALSMANDPNRPPAIARAFANFIDEHPDSLDLVEDLWGRVEGPAVEMLRNEKFGYLTADLMDSLELGVLVKFQEYEENRFADQLNKIESRFGDEVASAFKELDLYDAAKFLAVKIADGELLEETRADSVAPPEEEKAEVPPVVAEPQESGLTVDVDGDGNGDDQNEVDAKKDLEALVVPVGTKYRVKKGQAKGLYELKPSGRWKKLMEDDGSLELPEAPPTGQRRSPRLAAAQQKEATEVITI